MIEISKMNRFETQSYSINSLPYSFSFYSLFSAKHFAAHTHTIFHEYVTDKDMFLATD